MRAQWLSYTVRFPEVNSTKNAALGGVAGTTLGAVGGALAGFAVGHIPGAFIGGIAGAVTGGTVGTETGLLISYAHALINRRDYVGQYLLNFTKGFGNSIKNLFSRTKKSEQTFGDSNEKEPILDGENIQQASATGNYNSYTNIIQGIGGVEPTKEETVQTDRSDIEHNEKQTLPTSDFFSSQTKALLPGGMEQPNQGNNGVHVIPVIL